MNSNHNQTIPSFRERQIFWMTIVVTVILVALYITSNTIEGRAAVVLGQVRFYIFLLLFLTPLVFWGVMTTLVTADGFEIRFGFLGRRGKVIPYKEIKTVRTGSIAWPKDFKFFGTVTGSGGKTGGFVTAYGEGVWLTTAEGDIFVNSRNAAGLAAAVRTALKKKSTH